MPRAIEVILKLRDLATTKLGAIQGKIQKFTKKVGAAFRTLVNIPNILAGMAIFRIGKDFLETASKLEIFSKQLLMVSNSAQEADSALNAIREFARTSPLRTEDVIQSYVRLRAVGLDPTMKQMRVMGGVAVLMNRDLADVSNALISRHARTLREYGIELNLVGKKAVLMSGDIRIETEKNNAAIREGILEIWEKRFPNAIEAASDTFKAKQAIMLSNVWELQAAIMENFMPSLKKGMDGLSDAIEKLVPQANKIAAIVMGIALPFRILFNGLQIAVDIAVASLFTMASIANLIVTNLVTNIKQLINPIITLGKLGKAVIQRDWDAIANIWENKGQAFKTNLATIGTAWKDSWNEIKEYVATASGLIDKNLGDIGESMAAIPVQWSKVAGSLAGEIPGTGRTGGGAPEGEGGAGEELKTPGIERVYATYKSLKEANDAWREQYRQGIEEITKEEWIERFGTFNERMALRITKIWQDFTSTIEDRIKYMWDVVTDLYSTGSEKIRAIFQMLYRTSTDLLYSFLSTFIKAKVQELAISMVTEKAKQKENITTAATEAAGASAGAAKSQASIPIAGPYLAAAAATAMAALLFGIIAKAKAYAAGTNYASGGLSLVGERGPELVNLPRGSRVYPNGMTNRMMNRQAVNVTYNINAPGASPETAVAIDDILRRRSDEMVQAIRRGYFIPSDAGIATV